MDRQVGRNAVLERLGAGRLALLGADEVVLEHAVDDEPLALQSAIRIADGVVDRRCLGQAGQDGRFGHGDVLQRLAEVDLACRCEAVCALAQKDLVHVNLENLIFAQQAFHLEGQQHFVNLARVGFLGRQVEVARDLHRDGRRALAARAAELRQAGAQHAFDVHAAVLVEARVLRCQHGVLHHLGNLRDGREVAPLITVFAQHHPVGRVDVHGELGPIVDQPTELGKIRIGHRKRHGHDHQHRNRTGCGEPEQPGTDPHSPRGPAGRCDAGLTVGRGASGGLARALGFAHETPTLQSRIIESGSVAKAFVLEPVANALNVGSVLTKKCRQTESMRA